MSTISSFVSTEKRPLVVVAGPTASGKSAIALEIATEIATEGAAWRGGAIINADASQVYRDLRILSARPVAADEERAPHLLFGVLDGAERCSAALWAGLARAAIEDAWRDGLLPILVGGTGLYLCTLLEGIAPVPPIAAAIRAEVRAMAPEDVRRALQEEDAAEAALLHPADRQRAARALEVRRGTGRPLSHWRAQPRQGGLGASASLHPLVLDPPRAVLLARIEARVDAMWRAGAVGEVRALAARGLASDLPVMRAIGVPPLMRYLTGQLTAEEARARWIIDTNRYAKRQQTWFRHQQPDWPRMASGNDATIWINR